MQESIVEILKKEILSFYNQPTQVTQEVSPQTVRGHLSQYDFAQPLDLEALLQDVMYMMRNWNIQISNPLYFGLFNPAPTFASVIAESLVALYNPQMAAWSHAPAANEIEQHTLKFIAQKIGYKPTSTFGNFTSGGSEANHTGVLVALAHHFPGYLDKGMWALKNQPVFYVSELAHNSFDKIAKHTGLGMNALRIVPTNSLLKMDMMALATMVNADKKAGYAPFMVVGTAGITSTGTIDPLDEIASFCEQEQLWFHVDAAWAGAAVFSPTLKVSMKGIEKADSATVDAHKWFNLSLAAGMFFTKHQEVVRQTFSVRADYMPKSHDDVIIPYSNTLQWTRRCLGLKLFMTLAEMGEENFGKQLDNQAFLGDYFREKLLQNGWIIVNETPLPVVNFTHTVFESGEKQVDEALSKLYEAGRVWLSSVTIAERKVFRMCVTNFKTTETEVDVLFDNLQQLI